jgi:predicted DNA-binding transcriptional regulator AlpA
MPAPRSLKPVAVRDTTAAAMLDMSAAEFRRLVERGALPPPARIGDLERWDYAHIKCVSVGVAAMAFVFFDRDEEWTWADLLDEYEHVYGLTDKPSRHIPIAIRVEVFLRDGERCTYCGNEEPPFHLDHVFPLSRGGETSADNLVVACRRCNLEKHARTVEEWQGGSDP